jgi:excisionase family DNA binding protein
MKRKISDDISRHQFCHRLPASYRANGFDVDCRLCYNCITMNKEDAATSLGISVRSLQRLVQSGKISVTYKRGESGKQEAIFNPEEVENYKRERDAETVKPALATTNDTALARSGATTNDTALARNVIEAIFNSVGQKPAVAIADKPLLKLDEAAALTGLSRDILRKAIDTKELKGKLIGKAYRVKRDDLDKYIKNL